MLRHSHLKHQIPRHPSLRAFGYLAVLQSAAQGAFFTTFPVFLEEKLGGTALVGYYYALIAVISLAASVASTVIFQRVSRIRIYYWSFIIAALTVGSMTLVKNIWHIAALDIPRAIAVVFANIVFSLFIADYVKREVAKGQAAIFAWSNLGWLIGPLIGGLAAARWGHEAAFILSSVMFMISLVFFAYQHLVVRHEHFRHGTYDESLRELWDNIKAYWQRPELRRVFRVTFGLNTWWTLRGIYIPLSIIALGFGLRTVGWVSALTGVPLLLLEFWTGKQADRNGVRKYIVLGFAAIGVSAALFGAFSAVPYVLFTLFVVSNFGAALVEPLQNTYLLEAIRPEEKERFFGIYNTGAFLASILAPIAASVVFSLGFGLRGIWIFLAIAMLLFFGDALLIRKKY